MSKTYSPMSRWTPELAVKRTKRRAEEIQAALADIADVWTDIEPGTVKEVEQIFEVFGDDLGRLIRDLEAWISEKKAAGEEIGP